MGGMAGLRGGKGVKLIDLEDAKAAIRAKFKSLEDRVEINTVLNEQTIIDAIPVEWLKVQIYDAIDDNETELASDIGWLIRAYKNEQHALKPGGMKDAGIGSV